jgi:hypothetical protein
MAFVHGKKGRLWVNGFELSKYFTEFGMAGKAGTADVTAFGQGAKSFISGLTEGTLTGKGWFGSSTTDIEDSTLSAALGAAANTVIVMSPTGATTPGTRAIISEAAETDYSVMNPVSGAVSTSFSALADSGLSTGVILNDPTAAAITTATTSTLPTGGINDMGQTDSPTTTYTGTGGTSLTTIITAGVIAATNPITQGFTTTGYISVVCNLGVAILSYTGTTSTQFTGLALVAGTGSWTVGTLASIKSPYFTNQGAVVVANVLTVGTNESDTLTLLSSDDGSSWAQVGTQSAVWTNATGIGGYYFTIPANIPIFRYIAAQLVTTGTTINFTGVVAAARQ